MTQTRTTEHRYSFSGLLVALALLATACSGSDAETSENLVPLDAPAPGVLYVSTTPGDVQIVTPATGDARVFTTPSTTEQPVLDIAPAASGTGLNALARVPNEPVMTSAATVNSAGLNLIETPSTTLTCLDNHTNASTAIAHDAAAGDSNRALFTAVAFAGGGIGNELISTELESEVCPRWTADRTMVATATPTRAGDPSSTMTVVQTNAGLRHEIAFDQCSTTPTSFSPDDKFLALALTCYSASWDTSGLYLVATKDLDDPAALADLNVLTKLGSGLYGRTAWHPDGDWVAAMHAEPIELQNIAVDLASQPVGLQVIEIDTRQVIDVALADGAEPFSAAWLKSEIAS